MDIVSLLKILVRFSLALIPISAIALIITAYQSDIGYVISSMTDNGVIIIIGMTMDRALEIPAISALFGTAMTAIATVAIFSIR